MDRIARGELEYEAYMGVTPETGLVLARMGMPEMYETILGAFAGPLARPELSRADRELVTVAVLAAIGDAPSQLAVHVAAAMRAGYQPAELRAVCEHVSLYAGIPRALNALEVVTQVLDHSGIGLPARQQPVDLFDHQTVVEQVGDSGPATIFVHSLGADRRMWEPVLAPLARGRRLFAYDLRGHGTAAGAPEADMEQLSADLIDVIDALGLDTVHLVGLSIGGAVAQTAAVRHRNRFASLALLATIDAPLPSFEDRARAAETEGMEAQVVPTLTRWFTSAELATNAWGVRYAREHLRRTTPADWAAAWRAYATLDVQQQLEEIALPTLVLAGEDDASATADIMAGIAKRIPGASYQQLPGTSHQQTLSQPTLVADSLAAFLPKEDSAQ